MTSGFSSVQLPSHVWLFETPWTAACQTSLSITNSLSLLKLTSFELVMPSNHLILCHLLLLLPSIFPNIRVFSKESVLCIRWPKYWSFSFSPSNECSGLISFRIDWLDLLAVQGTFKNLLQYLSLKATIFWHSSFFMVQLFLLRVYGPTLFFIGPTPTHTQSQSVCLSTLRWFSHIEMTSASLWSSSFSKYWDGTKLSLVSVSAAYPIPLSWFLTLITLHWGIHTIAGPFLYSLSR